MSKTLFLTALLLCALPGCVDSPTSYEADDTLAMRVPPSADAALAYGAPGVLSGQRDWADTTPDEAFLGQFELFELLGPLAEPTALPTDEDFTRYRAFFAEHANHPSAYLAEQTVAFQILDLVAADPNAPSAPAAAAFAARALVDNENPNTDKIAAALALSRAEWTDTEMARAKQVAADAGRSWAESACRGCDRGNEAGLSETGGERRGAVLAAAEALDG